MAGIKTFVNNTGKELYVTLYIRKGANRSNGNAGDKSFILPVGARGQVESYGNNQNVYLNAIIFSWDDDGARLVKEQEVTQQSSWIDDLLNTNSIITFNQVGRANMTGSN